MKNQMLTLIIGILIGAVVSTIVFIGIRIADNKSKGDNLPSGFEEKMKGERPSFDSSDFPDRRNSSDSNSKDKKDSKTSDTETKSE